MTHKRIHFLAIRTRSSIMISIDRAFGRQWDKDRRREKNLQYRIKRKKDEKNYNDGFGNRRYVNDDWMP